MQLPELSAGALAILKAVGIMLALMALGLTIERIRPAEKGQAWIRVWLNLAYMPVYLLTIFLFAPRLATHLPPPRARLPHHHRLGQHLVGHAGATDIVRDRL